MGPVFVSLTLDKLHFFSLSLSLGTFRISSFKSGLHLGSTAMASGVAVSQECKNSFDEVKQKKLHRYIVYHIEDEKMIVVEKIGARDATYDDFITDLTKGGESECRYGLYDYEYTQQCEGTDDRQVKKLFLMLWCPDSAKIKKKMLYSSSFDAIRKALVGVQKYIQATDTSEASKDEVDKKIRQNDRN